MFLSVVIPAYNEEKRIKKTLLKTSAYLAAKAYSYEIIVVNDGSDDDTVNLVRALCIEHLVIIDNKKNRGKGYAVRQGLLQAKGEQRLFMDADNSTCIEEVEKCLPYLGEYSIVIGSRAMHASNILQHQPLRRRILAQIFKFSLHAITGVKNIQDTQCGFKVLQKTVVDHIMPQCNIDGFAFDVEMLTVAQKLGYSIKEVPVTWKNDTATKVGFKEMCTMGIDLLKIRWNASVKKSRI